MAQASVSRLTQELTLQHTAGNPASSGGWRMNFYTQEC